MAARLATSTGSTHFAKSPISPRWTLQAQGQSLYPHHARAFARDAGFRARYTELCLCELPGVSAVPLRAGDTYPTARECVRAFERFASDVLGLRALDAVGHSAGAHVLSYASRYAPRLFERTAYAEAPCVFFPHATKPLPLLFSPYTLRRLARDALRLDVVALSNWLIMSEVHHQHVLVNATWFMEVVHQEDAATLGTRAMVLMGTDDHYVNGRDTATYLARHHPKVRVHLMEGWAHGAFWDPTNLRANLAMLRAFLCDEPRQQHEGSPATVRAVLRQVGL